MTFSGRYLYLKTQLSLDIPTISDSRTAALLREAGAFAGFEPRTDLLGWEQSSGPSTQIYDFAGVLTILYV